jgi:hypothetical protein
VKLGQHQEAFAADFCKLLQYGISLGYAARIGEVLRPLEMQQIYVQTGRSKTMNSKHIKKCAVDIDWTDAAGNLCHPEEIGRYWESLNPLNSAGMFWNSFHDAPHYERRC